MMKPTYNDVRATDLSGGRNGEFSYADMLERRRRLGAVFQTAKSPRFPFLLYVLWSPTQTACALVWKNIYKGGGHPGDYAQVGSEERAGAAAGGSSSIPTVINDR